MIRCIRSPAYALRLLLFALLVSASRADETATPDWPSLEFIRNLQQRQLHRLAEVYCREQLQLSGSAGPEMAPIVVALLNSLASRAVSQRDLDDMSLWTEADAIANDYQQRWAPSSASYEIELRQQLVRMIHANALLTAAELDPQPQQRREQANLLLRLASRSLKDLNDRATELLGASSADQSPDRGRDLQRLLQQIQFAAGQVHLRQAACYPDRSPDRVHLLTEALRDFSSLARITPPSELSWESRISEIECQRRLRNFQVAHQRLDQMADNDLEPRLRWLHRIEEAKLDIDEGRPRRAAERLLAIQQQSSGNESEDDTAALMLTLIEAYVELAKQAGASAESSESRHWQTLALDVVRQMEQQVSSYWVRQAEMILSVPQQESAGTTELEIMSRTAANLYRREQYAEACVAYQRAAQLAMNLNLSRQAFDLGMKAAAIKYRTQAFNEAVPALRQLAEQHPDLPQAAQAHWLAVTGAAELARQDSSQTPTYESLLNEHLRHWPNGERADDARYWLGKLWRQKGAIQQATELWREVLPESQSFTGVMNELRQVYHQQLSALTGDPLPQRALAAEAIRGFSDWRKAIQDVPSTPSAIARDLDLTIGELELFYGLGSTAKVHKLSAELEVAERENGSLSNRRRALHGLALALDSLDPDAQQSWDEVDWQLYEFALPLVARLHESMQDTSATATKRVSLARLQWRLVRRLLASRRWSDNQQLSVWGAIALAESGQRQPALEMLAQLTARSPRDAELQRVQAELWGGGDTATDQQHAVDHWRSVVGLVPAESEAWYRAKLGIARGLIHLGQPKRAAEMIRVLQALHPELGGPESRREFLDLLHQAEFP